MLKKWINQTYINIFRIRRQIGRQIMYMAYERIITDSYTKIPILGINSWANIYMDMTTININGCINGTVSASIDNIKNRFIINIEDDLCQAPASTFTAGMTFVIPHYTTSVVVRVTINHFRLRKQCYMETIQLDYDDSKNDIQTQWMYHLYRLIHNAKAKNNNITEDDIYKACKLNLINIKYAVVTYEHIRESSILQGIHEDSFIIKAIDNVIHYYQLKWALLYKLKWMSTPYPTSTDTDTFTFTFKKTSHFLPDILQYALQPIIWVFHENSRGVIKKR
jgi:hypothetical protein